MFDDEGSSETSVDLCQITQRCIIQDSHLCVHKEIKHVYMFHGLKFTIIIMVWRIEDIVTNAIVICVRRNYKIIMGFKVYNYPVIVSECQFLCNIGPQKPLQEIRSSHKSILMYFYYTGSSNFKSLSLR